MAYEVRPNINEFDGLVKGLQPGIGTVIGINSEFFVKFA